MRNFFKHFVPSCFLSSNLPDDSKIAADPDHNPNHDPIQRFGSSSINALLNSKNHPAVIGEGGSSTVYLAALTAAGPAAFKVHDPSSARLYKTFRQELDVLRHVAHPNIVRLLGYSDDGDQAGVLVLEHVDNGTLHDKLHSKSDTLLSWTQRMSIAFKLAEALDYLHEGCDLQIIHGDIKPSNVLLDSDLNPKLCDFGSARMGFSAVVARSAAPMMGSPGYVDPWYLRTGVVSKKSDVYSFGVLVLELITGVEAFSMRPQPRRPESVDRRLGDEFDGSEGEIMVEIAGRCVGGNPSVRPSMGEIVRIMREKVSVFGDHMMSSARQQKCLQ